MDPNCPECGQPMAAGSFGSMSYLGGAQWYAHRSLLALDGEKISTKPLGGMIWLDGFRCPKCHILVLKY